MVSRDNARTPCSGTAPPRPASPPGTTPWLAVNPNYKQINAAQEESDPASVLNYMRALIALRAHSLAFVYGDYEDLDPQHPRVFAYTRSLGSEKYLVVENLSSSPVAYTLADGLKAATLLLSDVPGAHEANAASLNLAPWESRIYKQQ